ncbi:hypothetical protein G7076_09695 [Sphingomonas sp. HDW15A]|uniref:hypothetical protein n=1 Tax=Sphingomonas sp. HDW15A TaxID=2714942 RepID=UPI00140AEF5D|nr:hypothetical protein [Sphingomonas sp. HDW15A]QIK96671.1 hypothetical protein G7076_09695 [Sphingomonas sp. HDW15A]
MDYRPAYPSLSDRMTSYWERGVRIATRFAIAFGLSTLTAIGIGFAVTDNVLAQIFVTILAAFALWIPFVIGVTRFEAWRNARRHRKGLAAMPIAQRANPEFEQNWQRLVALAPAQRERLAAIKSSIDRSRLALGKTELDPDAHDLCILIDRRLPELVRHELEDLPPDDAGRRQRVGELVDLVEQFARHCGRQRDGLSSGSAREAAILRRRFEARLADHRDDL